MTTHFRNPWIDPRILDVQPAAAEEYLRTRGWQEAESGSPHWRRFLSPADGVPEAVLVPGCVDDNTLVNLLAECVGTIAAWEGRYAGDVLNELLATSAGVHANGTATLPVAGRR